MTVGYRIEVDGYTIVYSTDHEPHDCRLAHGGLPLPHSEDALHGDFLAQADYVIHDTQYLSDEYEARRGWGHSTMEYVVDLAHHADVKNLIMFHHDPMRSDKEIDHIVHLGRERVRGKPGKIELLAASELQPIIPHPKVKTRSLINHNLSKSIIKPNALIHRQETTERTLLCVSSNHDRYSQTVMALGHKLLHAAQLDDFLRLCQAHLPSLIFLNVSSFEDLRQYYQEFKQIKNISWNPIVILLCQSEECLDLESQGSFDPLPIRLVEPVSDIYLRARIQTWLSRTSAHDEKEGWTRGHIPNNDSERSLLAHQVIKNFQLPISKNYIL